MLYAYLVAGTVDFDDVVVKQIVPASHARRYSSGRWNPLKKGTAIPSEPFITQHVPTLSASQAR